MFNIQKLYILPPECIYVLFKVISSEREYVYMTNLTCKYNSG
jgi:hypothetical protein